MSADDPDIGALMDRFLKLEALAAGLTLRITELEVAALAQSVKLGELEQGRLVDHEILAGMITASHPKRWLWGAG